MKLAWAFFIVLLGMCAVLIGTFFVEEKPTSQTEEGATVYLGHGFTHPDYATMQAGGDGRARHQNVLWLGLIYGLLQIAYFILALALGIRKGGSFGGVVAPLVIGGIGFAAIFTVMVYTYRQTMGDVPRDLVGSFPPATAWMVYGMWGFPLVFLVLYVFIFNKHVFTDDDLKRFREIVAKHGQQDGTAS